MCVCVIDVSVYCESQPREMGKPCPNPEPCSSVLSLPAIAWLLCQPSSNGERIADGDWMRGQATCSKRALLSVQQTR